MNTIVFLLICITLPNLMDRVTAQNTTNQECDPSLQHDLAPIYFSVFNTVAGATYSVGEFVQIMARFPDGVCNLPDPEISGPGCTPKINLLISVLGDKGQSKSDITIEAARGLKKIAEKFDVDYSKQEGFYDEVLGIASNPWLFYLQVEGGMSTKATGGLILNWIEIPKECDRSPVSFNTTRIYFENSDALKPKISIDTFPPEIESVYTTEKDGNYTAGDYMDIIVQFTGPVEISQQPDMFSQVWLAPCNINPRRLQTLAVITYLLLQVYLDSRAANSMIYGVPYIELNSKAQVPLRGYGRDTTRLSFVYQVGFGDKTPPGERLTIAPNTTIFLNGGTIRDSATDLDADLTVVPPFGAKMGSSGLFAGRECT